MYPERIVIFLKNKTNHWKEYRKLNYITFEARLNEESIVNSSIPIGFGCRRLRPENEPQISTNYGKHFEINQNFKHFNGSYSSKINADLNNSIFVLQTDTRKDVFLERKNNLYSFNLSDGECIGYDLEKDKKLNLFFIAKAFFKLPEIYYANGNYLGEYKLEDLDCLVFENKIDSSGLYYRDPDKKLDTDFNFVLSTHYYAKDSISSELQVPKRIELRFFNNSFEIVKLVIDINSFNSSPNDQEYNFTNCSYYTVYFFANESRRSTILIYHFLICFFCLLFYIVYDKYKKYSAKPSHT